MTPLKRPEHFSRLNVQCRSDLAWWSCFVESWNGVNFFPSLPPGPSIVADASGSWGCGAYCKDSLLWFQVPWPEEWLSINIAIKELFPLVISAAIWGYSWQGQRVTFHSDNLAVVQVLSSRFAKDPGLSHLLRCLFFFEAHFRFEHAVAHIAGSHNRAADTLSRNHLDTFYTIFPQAAQSPVLVPLPLRSLLLDHNLVWTSPRWKELFRDPLRRVSPAVLAPHTHQLSPDISTSVVPSASAPSH